MSRKFSQDLENAKQTELTLSSCSTQANRNSISLRNANATKAFNEYPKKIPGRLLLDIRAFECSKKDKDVCAPKILMDKRTTKFPQGLLMEIRRQPARRDTGRLPMDRRAPKPLLMEIREDPPKGELGTAGRDTGGLLMDERTPKIPQGLLMDIRKHPPRGALGPARRDTGEGHFNSTVPSITMLNVPASDDSASTGLGNVEKTCRESKRAPRHQEQPNTDDLEQPFPKQKNQEMFTADEPAFAESKDDVNDDDEGFGGKLEAGKADVGERKTHDIATASAKGPSSLVRAEVASLSLMGAPTSEPSGNGKLQPYGDTKPAADRTKFPKKGSQGSPKPKPWISTRTGTAPYAYLPSTSSTTTTGTAAVKATNQSAALKESSADNKNQKQPASLPSVLTSPDDRKIFNATIADLSPIGKNNNNNNNNNLSGDMTVSREGALDSLEFSAPLRGDGLLIDAEPTDQLAEMADSGMFPDPEDSFDTSNVSAEEDQPLTTQKNQVEGTNAFEYDVGGERLIANPDAFDNMDGVQQDDAPMEEQAIIVPADDVIQQRVALVDEQVRVIPADDGIQQPDALVEEQALVVLNEDGVQQGHGPGEEQAIVARADDGVQQGDAVVLAERRSNRQIMQERAARNQQNAVVGSLEIAVGEFNSMEGCQKYIGWARTCLPDGLAVVMYNAGMKVDVLTVRKAIEDLNPNKDTDPSIACAKQFLESQGLRYAVKSKEFSDNPQKVLGIKEGRYFIAFRLRCKNGQDAFHAAAFLAEKGILVDNTPRVKPLQVEPKDLITAKSARQVLIDYFQNANGVQNVRIMYTIRIMTEEEFQEEEAPKREKRKHRNTAAKRALLIEASFALPKAAKRALLTEASFALPKAIAFLLNLLGVAAADTMNEVLQHAVLIQSLKGYRNTVIKFLQQESGLTVTAVDITNKAKMLEQASGHYLVAMKVGFTGKGAGDESVYETRGMVFRAESKDLYNEVGELKHFDPTESINKKIALKAFADLLQPPEECNLTQSGCQIAFVLQIALGRTV